MLRLARHIKEAQNYFSLDKRRTWTTLPLCVLQSILAVPHLPLRGNALGRRTIRERDVTRLACLRIGLLKSASAVVLSWRLLGHKHQESKRTRQKMNTRVPTGARRDRHFRMQNPGIHKTGNASTRFHCEACSVIAHNSKHVLRRKCCAKNCFSRVWRRFRGMYVNAWV